MEERLPVAEEYLKLVDILSGWREDREIHIMVAAEVAVSFALVDRWEPAATAYRRPLRSRPRRCTCSRSRR
ncbi:hypothetical protein [Streptomyces sp. NPDC019224]|uniref:hypothetical protein n=1 Tax=Streptomyces sp. NPDC019224 TaxID=3154484 RepID=UPI0033C04C58